MAQAQQEEVTNSVHEAEGEAPHKTALKTVAEDTSGFRMVAQSITGLVPLTKYHARFIVFPPGSSTAIPSGETEFETVPTKAVIEEEFSEMKAVTASRWGPK